MTEEIIKSKTAPFFIDKTRKKYYGEEAHKKLLSYNDRKYLNYEAGVVSVNEERWKEAQEYERKIWMEDLKFENDDNNKRIRDKFNDYSILNGKKFDRVIELGCGPFTNLRYVLSHIKCQEIDLLDPLIQQYLTKKNCAYRNGLVSGDNTWWNRIFGEKKQVKMHGCAIEDFITSKKYDLIIMINVLEHCKDFEKIKEKILSISKKGTHFIFSDKIFSIEEIKEDLKNTYDAGHPLRINKEYLMKFLEDNFRKIYWETKMIQNYRKNRDLSKTEFYYIGEKIV
jgi:SAM-dependent methyltransferase